MDSSVNTNDLLFESVTRKLSIHIILLILSFILINYSLTPSISTLGSICLTPTGSLLQRSSSQFEQYLTLRSGSIYSHMSIFSQIAPQPLSTNVTP